MKLYFATNGNNQACLGTFKKLTKQDLIKYVKMYERHWVRV